MRKFTHFMEEKFIPIATRISNNKLLKSISSGSMSLLGVIMLGAIFSVITSITWEPFVNLLNSFGLLTIINYVPNVTTNLIGLYMAFSIAYQGSKVFGIGENAFNTGIISLVSFVLLSPITVNEDVMPATNMFDGAYFGPKAVISAIIVSLIVIQIMKFFMSKNLTIKMPQGVPQMVSDSFTSLIPAVVIVLFFAIVKYAFAMTPYHTLNDFIYSIIQIPLQSLVGSLPAFLLLLVISQLLWFFGIHGSQTVLPILMPIWLGYMAENSAIIASGGTITNIINFGLWDLACIGGSGATIGLVFIMFFMSKSKRYKAFGKIALPCGIFSINEPLIFGMPLMLNVMTLIPFVLCPVVVSSIGYLLIKLGIIAPYIGILGTGSLPPLLHGIVNGSLSAGIYELVAVFISALIWYPFFKMIDKQAYEEESKLEGDNHHD